MQPWSGVVFDVLLRGFFVLHLVDGQPARTGVSAATRVLIEQLIPAGLDKARVGGDHLADMRGAVELVELSQCLGRRTWVGVHADPVREWGGERAGLSHEEDKTIQR